MSEIDPYVRILLFRSADQLVRNAGYFRRDEISKAIQEKISEMLFEFDTPDVTDVGMFAEAFIDELVSANVIDLEEQPFAGQYYSYNNNRFSVYKVKALQGDLISAAAERIGPRFFPDVFRGFISGRKADDKAFPALGLAPASNRVVTFSDNQIRELEDQASSLIEAVADQNRIDDSPGLREILLGQLKAGRELIRAGSFRLYILEVTLIASLKFLVQRYEHEAIGSLALLLMTALAKHTGIDV